MDDILYVNPARQRFYRVPAGTPLPDGAYLVVPVPGRPRSVNRAAIADFEIGRAEAMELAQDRARGGLDDVLAEARRMVDEQDGGRLRGWTGKLGSLLQSKQVEQGLSLLGSALQDVAAEMRTRRERHPEPEPAGDVVREDELILCGSCLTALDDETTCPSCGADSEEVEAFRMTAAQFAQEPWTTCSACGDDLLKLASTCPECGAGQ